MPPLHPVPTVGNYYLHYTSREGAQGVISAGVIRPGRSGRVYLTQDLYAFGSDAANALSIVNKPVELACLVNIGNPSGPYPVEPIRDEQGVIREAGGTEYYTDASITVSQDKDRWLSLLEP